MNILLFLYIFSIGVLAIYGAHRIHLVYKADSNPPPPKEITESYLYPTVLIQLPMFNEANVVTRLIESICALEWPKDKLHVQVLDDSTDETTELAQHAIQKYKHSGISISYHHRTNRKGYKAGALKEGLSLHNADFVAIFDSDFMPSKDFLLQVMPYFDQEEIGMVQARWGHINQNENLLTHLSSILLDGHFLIEHNARNQSGCFFNFNGTAGVWRTQTIINAGGWMHDTITEDLDLSYRAQLKGWKFVFLPEVIAPAELPSHINAFRLQQYRWAKGSIQTAKKLLPTIIFSKIPLKAKIESLFHLSANVGYPLCLFWIITLPWVAHLDESIPIFWKISTVIFGFIGVLYFYGHAMKKGQNRISIPTLFLVLGLGVGMSINQSIAFFAGMFRTDPIFVRTPKKGNKRKQLYTPPKSAIRWIELGLCIYCFASIPIMFESHLFLAIPFLCLFGWGFFFVSGFTKLFPYSFLHILRQNTE